MQLTETWGYHLTPYAAQDSPTAKGPPAPGEHRTDWRKLVCPKYLGGAPPFILSYFLLSFLS